jgi:periplasmic protein TonB
MANDLLNPTEADTAARLASRNGHPASMQFGAGLATETGHELDALLGKAFEEKSVWADLYDNLHELFFPTKLPPLELTSTPIPVPDPMAVKRSPAAVAISTLVNGGILALLLFAFRGTIIKATNQMHLTNLDPNISPWKPTTKNNGNIGGGGGGGSHDIVDPIKGRLPPRQKDPLLQPQVAVNPDPKLVLQPAIDVQKEIKLPDNPNLPNLGVTNSVNVQLA